MTATFISELQQLGLANAEAEIYTVLLTNGALGASAISNLTGIQRSNIYPILWSLVDKGLVEQGSGYGSRFTAVLPENAFPALIEREREVLANRKALASELALRMAPLAYSAEATPEELIQVVRNPKVIAERFDRLQLESKRQVDAIIKAPILNPANGNPAQLKAQRRGVHYRGLYEGAAIEEPSVKPFIESWIAAGEEARVYDGELPNKLIIFDREAVLLPLTMPGDQMRALFIRHPQLAMSLSVLFEFLWERAEPIALRGRKRTAKPAKSVRREGKELLGSNSNR
jgi:sugar-specific transcriptional regulator TrmB